MIGRAGRQADGPGGGLALGAVIEPHGAVGDGKPQRPHCGTEGDARGVDQGPDADLAAVLEIELRRRRLAEVDDQPRATEPLTVRLNGSEPLTSAMLPRLGDRLKPRFAFCVVEKPYFRLICSTLLVNDTVTGCPSIVLELADQLVDRHGCVAGSGC